MSESADPQVPVVDNENSAIARLTAHLAQLDFDAPTLELLLAALTADECEQPAVA
jgi:hypothetical protein